MDLGPGVSALWDASRQFEGQARKCRKTWRG